MTVSRVSTMGIKEQNRSLVVMVDSPLGFRMAASLSTTMSHVRKPPDSSTEMVSWSWSLAVWQDFSLRVPGNQSKCGTSAPALFCSRMLYGQVMIL